ncbi:hypothetical protein N657DRAFT_696935 [Parathielavia appendiculata]|uniref:Uncharacterized protein n=1 Tax=Parathielavia appendiculata TaxID=2587402 RepID=A0AAN6Z9H6_9PEZI|nr:hypothetical protein N657DRAFT_696935 [Parathielavia appendiculata]
MDSGAALAVKLTDEEWHDILPRDAVLTIVITGGHCDTATEWKRDSRTAMVVRLEDIDRALSRVARTYRATSFASRATLHTAMRASSETLDAATRHLREAYTILLLADIKTYVEGMRQVVEDRNQVNSSICQYASRAAYCAAEQLKVLEAWLGEEEIDIIDDKI